MNIGRAGILPLVAVVAAAAMWGTTGTAKEKGPVAATALAAGTMRLIVGAATLVAIAHLRGALRGQPWRRCGRNLAIGGVAVFVYQISFFIATTRAGVAIATVVTIGSGPVFSGVLAWATGRGLPGQTWAAATVLTIVGVVLLGFVGSDGASADALGLLAALTSGCGYAVYATVAKGAMDNAMHPTTTMAALFAIGAVIASPLLLFEPLGWLGTGGGVLMVMHLGVLTLGIGYVLYGWGLRSLAVPTAVTLTLAEPVVAAIAAVVVLDERLSLGGWLGAALVVVGLFVVGRSATDRTAAAEPAPV